MSEEQQGLGCGYYLLGLMICAIAVLFLLPAINTLIEEHKRQQAQPSRQQRIEELEKKVEELEGKRS